MADFKKRDFPWFVVVAIAYCLGYGWFLWYSDFLPYVLDNNETFSSLVHAANIYNFGVEKTFGLTDEAYGMSAAAHPYVYTHQGNFPRFYALLLYVLGARSPEAQIAITTFTIGFAGIYFAYLFVSGLVHKPFAVIFCLVMMSDYLMFAQWQVNTWQVWHLFFFFSSLLCVNGLREGRLLLWLPLSILNFSCLFYYEILFSVFVLTFCGLYAIYFHRHHLRKAISAIFVMGAGAGLGATALIAQNIAYFGVEKFLLDLKLTYLGRNMASSSANFLEKLAEFYEQNNIVFWHNIVDATYLRLPHVMIQHFMDFVVAPYTPYLAFLVLAMTLAYALSLMCRFDGMFFAKKIEDLEWLGDAGPLILAAAFSTFAGAVLVDQRVLGIDVESAGWKSLVIRGTSLSAIFLAAFFGYKGILKPSTIEHDFKAIRDARLRLGEWALLISFGTTKYQSSPKELGNFNIALTVLYLLVVSALVRTQVFWYDPIHRALWDEAIVFSGSAVLLQVFAVTVVWVAAGHVLKGGQLLRANLPLVAQRGIFLCVIFGFVAFAMSAFLIPGYLKTVYLGRYAPLTIFFHALLITLLIYTLGVYAKRCFVLPCVTGCDQGSFSRIVGIASVGSLLFVIFYWTQLQFAYITRLPPDHYAFLKELRSPPFKGASFAVNTYAAPVAASTGSWAYFDTSLGGQFLQSAEKNSGPAQHLKLLWVADKRTNPVYSRPDYFICIRSQFYHSGGIIGPYGYGNPPLDGCSRMPFIALSHDHRTKRLDYKVVASDDSGRDRWAIVRLNWGVSSPLLSK